MGKNDAVGVSIYLCIHVKIYIHRNQSLKDSPAALLDKEQPGSCRNSALGYSEPVLTSFVSGCEVAAFERVSG